MAGRVHDDLDQLLEWWHDDGGVVVNGEVDIYSSPVFADALRAVPEGPDALVDLRGVTFFSAAGVGAMVIWADGRAAGRVCRLLASPVVGRLFELTDCHFGQVAAA